MAALSEIRKWYTGNVRPQIKAQTAEYYKDLKPVILDLMLVPDAIASKLKEYKGYNPKTNSVSFPNELMLKRAIQKTARTSQRDERAYDLASTLTFKEKRLKVHKRDTNVYIRYKTYSAASRYDSKLTLVVPNFGMPLPPKLMLTGVKGPSVDALRRNVHEFWLTGKSKTRRNEGSEKFDEQALVSKARFIEAKVGAVKDTEGRSASDSLLLRALNRGTTLHDAIQARMGQAGRLVYRTGNLARSGKVDTVTRTSFKEITIAGTFQQDPYFKYFENPGYRHYTDARRPTKLVSGAIRDVVRSLLGNKFKVITRVTGA